MGVTWLLIQRDGKVYKEDLRGVYDVSYRAILLNVKTKKLTYCRARCSGRSGDRDRQKFEIKLV
jgi:hypothetical protein